MTKNDKRLHGQLPKVGIRPIIDGRRNGIRESLEEPTLAMAHAAAALIQSNLRHASGEKVECVIPDFCIGGAAEAASVDTLFDEQNALISLSVTPCWCYGSETMDMNPLRPKAIWGFNGTERPGAVYLAATLSAHTQKGLPCFGIYGQDVLESGDLEIPEDVKEKILRFVRSALSITTMRGKTYVAMGGVSMGIAGSIVDCPFIEEYLGMRVVQLDMTEFVRRMELSIFDPDEFTQAKKWVSEKCIEGEDRNPSEKQHSRAQKDQDWNTSIKMALIARDLMIGNPALNKLGYGEEALGHNAICGGFQGQRQWTDHYPNGDFLEAILTSSFDWNGIRQPFMVATENDALNGLTMLFGNLLTGTAQIFADVRTYWSPNAVKRVTGHTLQGDAAAGFLHLINSGPAALDGCAEMTDANGNPTMKPFWEMNQKDVDACLEATTWHPATLEYFRGGGWSTKFKTRGGMPCTISRINLVKGIGPVLQIAEGITIELPEDVHQKLDERTDPTWPTTWFVPRLTDKFPFDSIYTVMNNWGANHCVLTPGHIGADLITLASMLRIPVHMHNLESSKIFRPELLDFLRNQRFRISRLSRLSKLRSTLSMSRYYVGIDVGTGSARAGIFDDTGKMFGSSVQEIETYTPKADYVEQSSTNIWQSVCKAVRAAVKKSSVSPEKIGGIGFDATCSLVVLNQEGKPLTISPSGNKHWDTIVWMDHRALEQTKFINSGNHDVLKYVGGTISPEMQTPKLLWLKQNMPDTWKNAAHFFDLPDFLTWKATNSDIRSLCSTVCKWTYLGHEEPQGKWDEKYWRAIGLGDIADENWSRIGTDIQPMGRAVGNGLTKESADELGLKEGTPVSVSIIDAHAGGIGVIGAQTSDRPLNHANSKSRLALIGGTSSCHMAISQEPCFVEGIWGPYYSAMVPEYWLNEGGQSATGALIDHVIDTHPSSTQLKIEAKNNDITIYELLNDQLALLSEKRGCTITELTFEFHILPYFHGNRSPRADPNLMGMISGLRLSADRSDLALLYLSTIQAIAYGTRHIIEELNSKGYEIKTIFACGGGTKNPIFLQQHADITGCEIILSQEVEAVLLGSAILGAVASGDFKSIEEAMAAMSKVGRRIQPALTNNHNFHEKKYQVFKRMYDDQQEYKKIMESH